MKKLLLSGMIACSATGLFAVDAGDVLALEDGGAVIVPMPDNFYNYFISTLDHGDSKNIVGVLRRLIQLGRGRHYDFNSAPGGQPRLLNAGRRLAPLTMRLGVERSLKEAGAIEMEDDLAAG